MKYNYSIYTISLVLSCLITGCGSNSYKVESGDKESMTQRQQDLVSKGWYKPKSVSKGELSNEYGIKNKYGQQDNYFDIKVGNGCDVAIKILEATTDKCIRYVYVPENTTVNIQMIPQGKYYLKLAYGKDWMEREKEDGTIIGKFTNNVSYDKSIDIFDFGKKNDSNVVNYTLSINVVNSELENNFNTISISEEEFME